MKNDDGMWQNLNEQDNSQAKSYLGQNRKKKTILIIILSVIALIGLIVLVVCLVLFLKTDNKLITVKDLNITLIGETYPDGQRITAVAVDFIVDGSQDHTIDNSKLTKEIFSVDERNVTKIHSTSSLSSAHKEENGRYVIIELDPKDPEAPIVFQNNEINFQGRKNVTYHVQQHKEVQLTNGKNLQKTTKTYTNEQDINKAYNLVVDEFKADIYLKEEDHLHNLSYNIYIPKSLQNSRDNEEAKYPLILFMPDASVKCNDTRMTLFQGVGATVWATEEEQKKHESFVVAPCFTETIVNDSYMYTDQYLLIIPMLNDIINNKFKNKIDINRLYTTGQSMGCMTSISLMCENPNFFASGLYVAGQWDVTVMENLLEQTFWILCSEADMKAPAQNDKAMERLEELGAKISRDRWYGNATETQKKENVEKILADGNNKMYVKFVNHTVMPDDIPYRPADEHMYTWKVAYLIEGVRDWLFRQHLN